MLRALFQARGIPEHPTLRNANDSDDDLQTRFAFGQRARLVDNERIDLFHELQRFGVLDQYAFPGAAPDAHGDRHRRGEA